jgi:hypothetical protein
VTAGLGSCIVPTGLGDPQSPRHSAPRVEFRERKPKSSYLLCIIKVFEWIESPARPVSPCRDNRRQNDGISFRLEITRILSVDPSDRGSRLIDRAGLVVLHRSFLRWSF